MTSKKDQKRVVNISSILILICIMLFSFKPKEKYIGIQLWSVRADMAEDPEATLEKLGKMGYKYIEAAGYADEKFYGMSPEKFRKIVEANGMTFLSSHINAHLPDDPDFADEAGLPKNKKKWKELMEWWDKAIEAHSAVGAKYIIQASMGKIGHESLAGLKNYCDYFNEVGEKCNEKGIKFGFHNHAEEFAELEGNIIYDFMLENTDPDKVHFQIDLYWIWKENKDPVKYFNNYPGRFETWHIKDKKEIGESGKINFEYIFNNAEKSGKKYIIVEIENYNHEPLKSAKISLDYLLKADYVKAKKIK